jgi:SAM-dependent methyltransferase
MNVKEKLEKFNREFEEYRWLDQRFHTFKRAFQLMIEREAKLLIETGTARGNRSEGESSKLFAGFCETYGGHVYSVDINQNHIDISKNICREYSTISHVCCDSIVFLENFRAKFRSSEILDFIYIDSFDFGADNHNPPQDHALKEVQAAVKLMNNNKSIILIDDWGLPYGGKGGKAVPWLTKNGWQIIEQGYQILLVKD